MASPYLLLTLLFVACFSLATRLQTWYQGWDGSRTQSSGVINILMGDSRRLFANHFFVKADIYFHSGYYPSIFDHAKLHESSSMTQTTITGEQHDHIANGRDHHAEEREGDFMGTPKDWVERFGRNFYISRHTHLESNGDEREILPWLRISADLDPQRVETYTVAAYWLRNRLGKVKEAEQFLREGLRANPQSYEILFELGRVAFENRKDSQVARNIWELALRRWREQEERKSKPDVFLHQQIVGHLAEVEEQAGNWDAAKKYLDELKKYSPSPLEIQKQIDNILQQHSLPSAPQPTSSRDSKLKN
jgi:tetratricopeptide (TPR) repeat protein